MFVGESSGVKYDSGMENPNKGQTRDTLLTSVRAELEEKNETKRRYVVDDEEDAEDTWKKKKLLQKKNLWD